MNLSVAFGAVLAALLWASFPAAAIIKDHNTIIYVGTFKRDASKGIYAWRLDPGSGKTEPLGLVADTMRPLFLALHPNRRFLYAVSRPTAIDRQNIGVVYSYAVDAKSGKLTVLNSFPSRGIDPAYASVDRTGQNLLVANYGTNNGAGCIAIFPIQKDGSLADASEVIQYSGSSVHPQRQVGPHSHAITISPDNRFVLVADLGLDKIFVYRFDAAKGKVTPNDPPFALLHPGAGPRQFVFRPDGRFFYVINELQSTITTFAYEAASGTLKELQTLTTLPQDFQSTSVAGTIQVHPNGKFLYATNRGPDNIVLFSIDSRAGTLTFVESVSAQGKTPGSLAIDPDGGLLLAANQGSDTINMFRIDPKTGRLQVTGQALEVGTPSCVRFLSP